MLPHPSVAHGLAVGIDTLSGLNFDPNRPYAGCKICGAVFQSAADRRAVGPLNREAATAQRKQWSHNHATTHSDAEHRALALSRLWCTPEAANRLAAFGTIPLAVPPNSELDNALLESSPVPTNDCEE